jgi:hypothetical protein
MQAVQNVADSLATLATVFGIKGIVSVFDGKIEGWEHVERSVSYHFWCLKLRVESFFKSAHRQPNLTNYVSRIASILCYAIASETTVWEDYAAKALSAIVGNADALDAGYWGRRKFEPFVLALENYKRRGVWLSEHSSSGSVYTDIIENWDGEKFLESLTNVCDYHCQNMEDASGEGNAEFKYPPFDIFPIEVLAIFKVRARYELGMPKINHPLLKTPLATLAQIPMPSDDETLCEVQSMASRLFHG